MFLLDKSFSNILNQAGLTLIVLNLDYKILHHLNQDITNL